MTTLPLLKEVVSPAVVRALGYALLHSLWQGTVLALVLAGALPLLRQRRAELRYAVAAAALAGLVLVVGGTFGYYYQTTSPTVATGPAAAAVPVAHLLPAALPVGAPAEARPPTWMQATGHQCEPYLPLLVGAWLLGALLMGGRLLGGLLYAGRLRRVGTQVLGADWQQRLTALAQRAGLRRPVALLESARVAGPLVLGHLRPVILLPLGAVAGLSPALLEALLAHEVAHIARRDYLLNLGLAVAEVLFFYHPAVWFMAACLRAERENCCDDQAAALCGGDGLRVARALAALAELEAAAAPTPHLALAAAGVGGRGSLLARVRRLALGRPSAPTLAEGLLAGLLMLVGLLGLGTGVVLAAAPGRAARIRQQPTTSLASPAPADTVRRPGTKKAAVPVPPTPPLPPPPPNTSRRGSGYTVTTTSAYTVTATGDTVQLPMQLEMSDGESRQRRRAQASQQPQTVVVEKDKKGRVVSLLVNGQPVARDSKKAKHGKVASTTEIIQVPAPATFGRLERRFRFERPERPERPERLEQPELPELPESPLLSLDLSTDQLHDRTLQNAQRNLERALRSPGLNTEQFQPMRRDLQRMQADLQKQRRQQDPIFRLQQSPSGTFRLHFDKQIDADTHQAAADARQAQADARQAAADARQAQADAMQAAADARQAEADARESGRGDARASTEEARARRAELRARIAAAQAELRVLDGGARAPGYSIYGQPGRLKLRVQPEPASPRLPVPPAPPAPPAQGRPGPPPPPPPVGSDKLQDALRQDGLIGKTDRKFSFELNDQGGKVNGKALTADQVARYRQLLHQAVGSKGKSLNFNMTNFNMTVN